MVIFSWLIAEESEEMRIELKEQTCEIAGVRGYWECVGTVPPPHKKMSRKQLARWLALSFEKKSILIVFRTQASQIIFSGSFLMGAAFKEIATFRGDQFGP